MRSIESYCSERDDIIIVVADSLREECENPPLTLPEFDKLVQSVRRNRKGLPKSKARSKSLSVEREGPRYESHHESLVEQGQLTGQWPVSLRLANGVESMTTQSEVPPDSPKNSTAHSEMSYCNCRPSLQSRRSEPSRIGIKIPCAVTNGVNIVIIVVTYICVVLSC
ncbi:hypothetical protein V1523DRAFT_289134 [Lipomyces doorenjongii]